tara:strand:- start:238 stop:483 length:246 start_codon:yes stop_codon:yes gene_type:complete
VGVGGGELEGAVGDGGVVVGDPVVGGEVGGFFDGDVAVSPERVMSRLLFSWVMPSREGGGEKVSTGSPSKVEPKPMASGRT